MDCSKVGKLIFNLRKEKSMTQKELAEAMNLSDRTISKWERGIGCPDVSLLHELSNILGVNIEKILSGDLAPNDADGGNMKRVKFHVCTNCGNVLFSTGEAEISCCGRKLAPLNVNSEDESHLYTDESGYKSVRTFPTDGTAQNYILKHKDRLSGFTIKKMGELNRISKAMCGKGDMGVIE